MTAPWWVVVLLIAVPCALLTAAIVLALVGSAWGCPCAQVIAGV
jgi:hypothetical protein